MELARAGIEQGIDIPPPVQGRLEGSEVVLRPSPLSLKANTAHW